MILLAAFLAVLFRALVFIGLSLGIGGVIFYFLALRFVTPGDSVSDSLRRRAAALIFSGACLAAVCQLSALVIAPWALADEAGRWPLAVFLATGFARVGMLSLILECGLAGVAWRLRVRPRSTMGWAAAAGVAALIMASGAWLVHGASRLEHAAALMTVTVLHQLAAFAWIGGTMHLTSQWRLLQSGNDAENVWPHLTARFSSVAFCAVIQLVLAGSYMSWHYIAGIDGLVGTAYGTMLLTKIALMGSLLCLGGINFLTIRNWKHSGNSLELRRRLPVYAELEAGIGTAILMAAAAITGQPPAVDVKDQWASLSEVVGVFLPKAPQPTPAPIPEMLATAASTLDPFALPTALAKIQSNFNHNISGIFVILLGTAAFLDRATGIRWFRHWPLLFLLFGLFLFVVAEPTVWPMGNEGFWQTLAAPDVLQHRLATLLVIGLGLFEWNVRAGSLGATRWRYAFPLLCGIGGALLLSHSHSIFAVKWAFLIEVSHNAIGILAVLMGAGRWLELRLPGREGQIAGHIWPVCFTMVGVVLLFYRET